MVYAFEPIPSNLAALNETLNLNPDLRNVTVFLFALSNEIKKVQFIAPSSHNSGRGRILESNDRSNNYIDVDCLTIDAFSEQLCPAKMIYIDTEGQEIRILQGARKYIEKFKPYIVLEASSKLLSHTGFRLQDLYEEIKSLHYEVFNISRFSIKKLLKPN